MKKAGFLKGKLRKVLLLFVETNPNRNQSSLSSNVVVGDPIADGSVCGQTYEKTPKFENKFFLTNGWIIWYR